MGGFVLMSHSNVSSVRKIPCIQFSLDIIEKGVQPGASWSDQVLEGDNRKTFDAKSTDAIKYLNFAVKSITSLQFVVIRNEDMIHCGILINGEIFRKNTKYKHVLLHASSHTRDRTEEEANSPTRTKIKLVLFVDNPETEELRFAISQIFGRKQRNDVTILPPCAGTQIQEDTFNDFINCEMKKLFIVTVNDDSTDHNNCVKFANNVMQRFKDERLVHSVSLREENDRRFLFVQIPFMILTQYTIFFEKGDKISTNGHLKLYYK